MFTLKCYIVKIRLDLLVPGYFLKLLNQKSSSYFLEPTGIWDFLEFNYIQEKYQTHAPKHPLERIFARPIVNIKASKMVNG